MCGKKTSKLKTLSDRFGRKHDYLRLSITEECNFACSYCKPDLDDCANAKNRMSTEEVIKIADSFTKLGIKKIRLTGGEPLTHPDFETILKQLVKLPIELVITTNGLLLDKYFQVLKTAGIQKINISLDTLKPERFKAITQRNAFERVYANIILALNLGFKIKLNSVIMKGTNEDELIDFANLTNQYPLTVRFIEFMPFRDNNWNFGRTYHLKEMIGVLTKEFNLIKEPKTANDTTEYYTILGAKGKIGVISTVSHPFCENCNRLRVMADGKMKNCLFGTEEFDLIKPIRKGENLHELLYLALSNKKLHHGGNKPFSKNSSSTANNRNMYSIGG